MLNAFSAFCAALAAIGLCNMLNLSLFGDSLPWIINIAIGAAAAAVALRDLES